MNLNFVKNKYFFLVPVLILFFGGLFSFLHLNSRVILGEGEHVFQDDFVVGEDKILIIKPGANLKMGRDVRIVVEGKILAIGTKEKPIVFEGNGDYWRGIEIKGGDDAPNIDAYKRAFKEERFLEEGFSEKIENGNVFSNCIFKNLATNKKRDVSNRKKAVIEASFSSVSVLNSSFEDVVHIGCIQAFDAYLLARENKFDSYYVMKVFHPIRSVYIIDKNEIVPKRYEFQTWPDGLYGGYGVGIVTNNVWDGLSDDAIDFTASLGFIMGNRVKGTFDDGISLDNMSEGYMIDNEVEDILEHGFMVSNQSRAVLINNKASETKNTLLVRSGGEAYVKNISLSNSKNGILMNSDISIILSKSSYEKIAGELEKSSIDEANNLAIYERKSAKEISEFFRNAYYDYGGYKILKESINNSEDNFEIFDFLKKSMKLVDDIGAGVDFKEVIESLSESEKERLLGYENKLYLTDSKIYGNEKVFNILEPHFFFAENVSVNEDKSYFSMYSEIDENIDLDKTFKEAEEKKKYVNYLLNEVEKLKLKINNR